MRRAIVAVVTGYAVWTGIWLGGNALFFGEAAEIVGAGRRYSAAGPLTGVLALSVVCSLVAGLVTAIVAGAPARRALLVVSVLLLVTGIVVQAGVRDLMPVWYHLTFLGLLIPAVVAGGRLPIPRRESPPRAGEGSGAATSITPPSKEEETGSPTGRRRCR